MEHILPLINLKPNFFRKGWSSTLHLLCDIYLTTELEFLPFIRQALILKMDRMFTTP